MSSYMPGLVSDRWARISTDRTIRNKSQRYVFQGSVPFTQVIIKMVDYIAPYQVRKFDCFKSVKIPVLQSNTMLAFVDETIEEPLASPKPSTWRII
jgi:hypothetical protein